jgi:hypothetical protein
LQAWTFQTSLQDGTPCTACRLSWAVLMVLPHAVCWLECELSKFFLTPDEGVMRFK